MFLKLFATLPDWAQIIAKMEETRLLASQMQSYLGRFYLASAKSKYGTTLWIYK